MPRVCRLLQRQNCIHPDEILGNPVPSGEGFGLGGTRTHNQRLKRAWQSEESPVLQDFYRDFQICIVRCKWHEAGGHLHPGRDGD